MSLQCPQRAVRQASPRLQMLTYVWGFGELLIVIKCADRKQAERGPQGMGAVTRQREPMSRGPQLPRASSGSAADLGGCSGLVAGSRLLIVW